MAKGTRTRKARGKTRKKSSRIDARQSVFLSLYLDPKSATFSNALQSALKAKYSREYAENITRDMPAWFEEKLDEFGSMHNVERNFKEFLNLPIKTHAVGAFGLLYHDKKKKKPIITHNASLIKHKLDATKFIAETLGKKKYARKVDHLDIPPLQTLIIINVPNGKKDSVHTVTEAVGSASALERQAND